jgi:hypothetical protein
MIDARVPGAGLGVGKPLLFPGPTPVVGTPNLQSDRFYNVERRRADAESFLKIQVAPTDRTVSTTMEMRQAATFPIM